MFCNDIMNKKDKGGLLVNKKLTVAVIGCGNFAKSFVIEKAGTCYFFQLTFRLPKTDLDFLCFFCEELLSSTVSSIKFFER